MKAIPHIAFAQCSLTFSLSAVPQAFDSSGADTSAMSATVSWNVTSCFTGLNRWVVYPYFTSSSAFSGTYGHAIPTSDFDVSINGLARASCSGTGNTGSFPNPASSGNDCRPVFYGNSSANMFTSGIPLSGSQTTSITPSIANVGSFNADVYSGTLSFYVLVE